MKYTEIKKSINQLLSSKYPNIKIYGNEVKEGFSRPSFFIELIAKPSRAQTKNFCEGGFTIMITYQQNEKSELDQLQKFDEMIKLFGMTLQVGERRLLIKEVSYDYTGALSDILQINIDIDYLENTVKKSDIECADTYEFDIKGVNTNASTRNKYKF